MSAEVTAEYISEAMAECISCCGDCHDVCMETLAHCLTQGGRYVGEERMRALADCKAICDVTRDALLRGSALHARAAELCAEACIRCAEACRELVPDDPMADRCVHACRSCAEACLDLGSTPRVQAS